VWLGLETAAVALGTIAAVRILGVHCVSNVRWLAIASVLIAGALIPTWLTRREFPSFAADVDHVRLAVRTVCRVCIYIFPAVFLGLWLLTSLHLPIPLRPVIMRQQSWLAWLCYQFLYVAVAEEVFFRGYIQANVTGLLGQVRRLSPAAQQRIAIVISALCFAAAHVIVQGQITSALVFLPGLVMAWLFVRTRSLLAPILFHGLANVSYGVMALLLM
jgi:membrane protease YdiL (CAAX protease family)